MGLTGCEDKKQDDTPVTTENTTEIFTQKDINIQKNKRFKLEKKQRDLLDTPSGVEIFIPGEKSVSFTLLNTKSQSHKVTVSNQKVIFNQRKHAIVILNLFATWCPPCIGEIAYLNDLQKKYQENVFIAGILTHDGIDKTALETFISKHHINYFISNSTQNDAFASLLAQTLQLPENFSIPLTAMYVNGEYFTHYEGSVPVEMIEYDIQQAKKQLKLR